MYEINEQIQEIVNNEIESRTQDIVNDLAFHKSETSRLTKEVDRLKSDIELKVKEQENLNFFKSLKSEIDTEKIGFFISSFKLKESNIEMDKYSSEKLPKWFELFIKYYNDKEKLLNIFDAFDIEYPKNEVSNFKMPYEFNKKEIEAFLNNINKQYVTNSRIFEENIGYWYRKLKYSKFDCASLITGNDYSNIPWQLFLRNTLLKEEYFFNKIIEILNSNDTCRFRFYHLDKYINLTDQQKIDIFKTINSAKVNDIQKSFIKRNGYLFKKDKKLEKSFKRFIDYSNYSAYYFKNFSSNIQKDYLLYTCTKDWKDRLSMIENSDLTKEDKIFVINELINKRIK